MIDGNKVDQYKRLATFEKSIIWQKDLKVFIESLWTKRESSLKKPTTQFEAASREIERLAIKNVVNKIIDFVEKSGDKVSDVMTKNRINIDNNDKN